MSYGDGGFYFLQPVGWGSSYGDAGSDYAEGLPSKKEEKEGKWRTKHKGYDVVRRPVNIASEQERRAWLVFFKAKRNFWQNKVTNYKWIAAVAGPAGVTAAIAAVIATGGAAAAAALALGAGGAGGADEGAFDVEVGLGGGGVVGVGFGEGEGDVEEDELFGVEGEGGEEE